MLLRGTFGFLHCFHDASCHMDTAGGGVGEGVGHSAADANGDGTANALDLILLRQYLAGWDVTLGLLD